MGGWERHWLVGRGVCESLLVGLHSEYHANVEPETLCGFRCCGKG